MITIKTKSNHHIQIESEDIYCNNIETYKVFYKEVLILTVKEHVTKINEKFIENLAGKADQILKNLNS